MKFSILIPHFKTREMTAFSVSQFLKYKGRHELEIIVIDNSHPDRSIDGLKVFGKQVRVARTIDSVRSHGTALEAVMPETTSDWVITAESDSFPTVNNWLDYYEDLIDRGVDAAGSLLKLSGGTYLHPAGSMYKKSVWEECKSFCRSIPYYYYPNMSMKESFQCHTMIHKSLVHEFLKEPEDYVELAPGYIPFTKELAEQRRIQYEPVCGVFHNGMGNRDESIYTYGQRTVESEASTMYFDNNKKILRRIGFEPGQFFSYWLAAYQKNVFYIPTETRWVNGHEGRQQEYTLNEAGFKHIWCGSAYLSMKDTDAHDIYEFKKNQIEKIINQ